MTSQRGQAMVGCYGGSSTDRNGGGVGVDAMALRERERESGDIEGRKSGFSIL